MMGKNVLINVQDTVIMSQKFMKKQMAIYHVKNRYRYPERGDLSQLYLYLAT